MRNMRLNDLRKKKKAYFRSAKVSQTKGNSYIETFVKMAYKSLPKYAKAILDEDKERYIKTLVNIVKYGQEKAISPYKAFLSQARTLGRITVQARNIFARFRNEAPDVYAKYNSYMYRNGYSASQYFYANAKWNSTGSYIEIELELPKSANIISYNQLKIWLDASNAEYLEADMT